MSGPVNLTYEDMAADFCAANPGKSVIIGNVRRDAAGVVTYIQPQPKESKDAQEHKYFGSRTGRTINPRVEPATAETQQEHQD